MHFRGDRKMLESIKRLCKESNQGILVRIGLTFIAFPLPIIILLWPAIQNYLLLMILYMFIVGVWSMTWSIAVAYLMSLTPTLERGFVVSIRQTATRLGFTIGPLIGGYFWYVYTSTAPFYVSSVFFALSFFLILLPRKP